MEWMVNATPQPFYPQERPGTYFIGSWVGSRPVWTGAKNLAPPGFDPRTVQPLAILLRTSFNCLNVVSGVHD
jgi:hypothetical protein